MLSMSKHYLNYELEGALILTMSAFKSVVSLKIWVSRSSFAAMLFLAESFKIEAVKELVRSAGTITVLNVRKHWPISWPEARMCQRYYRSIILVILPNPGQMWVSRKKILSLNTFLMIVFFKLLKTMF